MREPTTCEGKINVNEIDAFIEKALRIATPLEGVLTTTLTQIYQQLLKNYTEQMKPEAILSLLILF